jgi:hypothetical protein
MITKRFGMRRDPALWAANSASYRCCGTIAALAPLNERRETRASMAKDLNRPSLEQLDWRQEARAASLSLVFEHAVGLAVSAEEWYASKRPSKRKAARILRVGAVLLGAVAVVLPILSEITGEDADPAIAPGWAAVALAAAAALITLDRFFGFSSGWMRFMEAELRLTRLRHRFEYDWNTQRAASSDAPNDAELSTFLTLARTFVLEIDKVVAEETVTWIVEFRGGLERTEQGLRGAQP